MKAVLTEKQFNEVYANYSDETIRDGAEFDEFVLEYRNGAISVIHGSGEIETYPSFHSFVATHINSF